MTDFEREAIKTIALAIIVIFVGVGAMSGWIYLASIYQAWKESGGGNGDDDLFSGGVG